jgi:hypothetical protein
MPPIMVGEQALPCIVAVVWKYCRFPVEVVSQLAGHRYPDGKNYLNRRINAQMD